MALNQVPQANQTLSVTQPLILGNFNVIDAGFSTDHVAFNAPNQGFHAKVTIPTLAAPPQVAGTNIIYCVTSALTGQPELVVAKQAGSTAPLAAQINEFTAAGYSGNGWTRLPSGILLKWGTFNANANVNSTIAYPVAVNIPVYTTIYTVNCTSLNGAGAATQAPQLSNLTVAGFDIFPRTIGIPIGATNGPYSYLAIGI